MGFGKRLKAIMDEKHISPTDLGRMTGVSRQSIYSWIKRDTEKIDPEIFARLAAALDIAVNDLLDPAATANSPGSNPDDIWQLREDLRNDPDRRALLMLAKNGSAQDVRQVAALIDALRATNSEFYDGDDPA
jgi:transcriptional regulator with XRE-family HTH domain